jgi:hypothetical protein
MLVFTNKYFYTKIKVFTRLHLPKQRECIIHGGKYINSQTRRRQASFRTLTKCS